MSVAEEIDVEQESPRTTNPFKFLDYYDENDIDIFAGRSEEVREILASFCIGTTFVLYGRSGLGKTSLIHAGLFPRMTEDGYVPIYARILDDPIADLATAVKRAPSELPQALSGESDGRQHVLVIDQFEEFFIRFDGRPDLRTGLAELLCDIAAYPGSTVRIIFSLREDYVANLDDLLPYLPDLKKRSFRLLPLTAYGTRQAILSMLTAGRIAFDSTVVNELVKRLESALFSPLVLQIYCTKVFETALKRDPQHVSITMADVDSVGRVDDIFRMALENVMEQVKDPDKRLLLCCILDVLKTSDRTKRAIRAVDVCTGTVPSAESLDVYFNTTEPDALWALEHLHDRHLVRRLPTRVGWYELLHDKIAAVVDDWLRDNKEFRNFRDAGRLIENLHGMDYNLADAQLRALIDPCRVLLRLSTGEVDFLFRSALDEKSESVLYWAARYDEVHGHGAAVGAVLDALESPERRPAALVAAKRMRASRFTNACREIALSDPNADVRRAAGKALASIDAEIDLQPLCVAVRRSKTRSNALDLFADLDIAARDLSVLGRWMRWRVRRRVHLRQLRDAGDVLTSRTTAAGMFGATGAALWYLLILTPFIYVFWSAFKPNAMENSENWGALGIWIIPLAILGAWLGRRATYRVTREAIINGPRLWRRPRTWDTELLSFFTVWALTKGLSETWSGLRHPTEDPRAQMIPVGVVGLYAAFLAVKRWRRRTQTAQMVPWWLPPAVLILAAAIAYAVADYKKFELPSGPFVATVLCSFALSGTTLVVERCRTSSSSAAVAAPLIAGYAFGAAPFFLLTLFIERYENNIGTSHLKVDLIEALAVFFILLSFRTTVNSFALVWAERLQGNTYTVPPANIGRAYATRSVLLLIAAVFTVTAAMLLGPNSLPILARPVWIDSDIVTMPRRWGNVEYLRVKSRNHSVAAFEEQITDYLGTISGRLFMIPPSGGVIPTIFQGTTNAAILLRWSPGSFARYPMPDNHGDQARTLRFRSLPIITDGDISTFFRSEDYFSGFVQAPVHFDAKGACSVDVTFTARPEFKNSVVAPRALAIFVPSANKLLRINYDDILESAAIVPFIRTPSTDDRAWHCKFDIAQSSVRSADGIIYIKVAVHRGPALARPIETNK